MTPREEPFAIPARDLPSPEAASPADAPQPPEDTPTGAAMLAVTSLAARPRSRLGRWLWSALTALLTFILSVAAYDYITGLLARNLALGWTALLLTGLVALLLLVQLLREWLAYRRLARMDAFHTEARAVLASGDLAAARALSDRLASFYAGRPQAEWGRRTLAEQAEGMLDADALLTLTERSLFAQTDQAARREIEAAARTVAAATALVPLALVDVMAALSANIRMIRRIAELYGGRAGTLGSWRLLRMVATHLLATGAVAAGDDLIHSMAGGGMLAKVSRRFGEGVVNGALTARVGIAAMEVCRPLPFAALPRPSVSNVLSRALTGLFQKS